MRVGELKGGDLYLRCPICGDSERDERKCHFSIQLNTGRYFCFRCAAGGRLSSAQYLDILSLVAKGEFIDELPDLPRGYQDGDRELTLDLVLSEMEPGSRSMRSSALPRYHLLWENHYWDVFLLRDPYDREVVGATMRLVDPVKKANRLIGEKGLAWPGGQQRPLTSSPVSPLRVVEGPYDVCTPQDVAVLGTFSVSGLRSLAGHSVILTPDGDIWTDPGLFQRFHKTVSTLLYRAPYPIQIVGVEYLPNNLDPDDVPIHQRQLIGRSELVRRFRPASLPQVKGVSSGIRQARSSG